MTAFVLLQQRFNTGIWSKNETQVLGAFGSKTALLAALTNKRLVAQNIDRNWFDILDAKPEEPEGSFTILGRAIACDAVRMTWQEVEWTP